MKSITTAGFQEASQRKNVNAPRKSESGLESISISKTAEKNTAKKRQSSANTTIESLIFEDVVELIRIISITCSAKHRLGDKS